ncbi:hypothetical protein AO370_0367 [Moraxella catarrhalis]|uniref:Uncharacterized protein n=1 Tax=Moraxella catarrhalis TaxID=480 RepID=A0AB36DQF5_MORCA|nr:hypothetical protein AO370_0367 [Moraxella catarrhalis]
MLSTNCYQGQVCPNLSDQKSLKTICICYLNVNLSFGKKLDCY